MDLSGGIMAHENGCKVNTYTDLFLIVISSEHILIIPLVMLPLVTMGVTFEQEMAEKQEKNTPQSI